MARSYQSTLTRKGQATIPIELREEFGLREGDKLIWSRENGHIVVTTAQELVRRTAGIFKDRVPPLPPGGIEQRMAEEKEAAARGWTERWDRFIAENEE
jgi:AbrB family looped-hinge helix DNA binding protein